MYVCEHDTSPPGISSLLNSSFFFFDEFDLKKIVSCSNLCLCFDEFDSKKC